MRLQHEAASFEVDAVAIRRAIVSLPTSMARGYLQQYDVVSCGIITFGAVRAVLLGKWEECVKERDWKGLLDPSFRESGWSEAREIINEHRIMSEIEYERYMESCEAGDESVRRSSEEEEAPPKKKRSRHPKQDKIEQVATKEIKEPTRCSHRKRSVPRRICD